MNFSRFKNYCLEYPTLLYEWFINLIYSIRGVWKIIRLSEPRVTIFGGARFSLTHEHATIARDLAHRLVEKNISIITGGGPGIMEAVNCGAADVAKKRNEIRSLGIGISGIPWEKGINTCAQDFLVVDDFLVRKWLLINYSVAFLVFPGGYGTLDELATVLTLIETKKIPKVPVILFGKEYWKPFMDWAIHSALREATVTDEEIKLITVTDDVEEVFCLLLDQCKLVKNVNIKDS